MAEMSKMLIETWPIDKPKLWEKNPRSISQEDFGRLKAQINELGAYKPLIVNEEGVVLGGNMRLRALRDIGVAEVVVSIVHAPSEDLMLKYALSDNDRAGNYNDEELAGLVLLSNIDMSLFKVDLGEALPLHVVADRFGPEPLQDDAPELDNGPADSQRGVVYQLGRHRLLCGDATNSADYKLLMGGGQASMVFTDPPYNVAYEGGGSKLGKKSRKKILNDEMSPEEFYAFLHAVMVNLVANTFGAFYICMSSSELHNLWKAFTDAGGHWQTYIIWAKDSFTLSRADYHHQFEPIMHGLSPEQAEQAAESDQYDATPILYGWTKHNWYGGRKQGDVWHIDRPKKSPDHPTMKPVALCARAIVNSSKRGDIVLDVFGGSGSTLMAAEQLDRTCYMMELDPHYCDVIRKRYAKFLGKDDEWIKTTPAHTTISGNP